jgi:tetratricopeptide (TPR) repeat protein
LGSSLGALVLWSALLVFCGWGPVEAPQLPRDRLLRQGLVSTRHGRPDIAIASFTEALSLDPKSAIAHRSRGAAYARKGAYGEAIRDFTAAIQLDPDYAVAYRGRGAAHNHLRDYDRAIADLSAALRLNTRDAVAYRERGVAYAERRDHQRAIADFTAAILVDPRYAEAYADLAWLLATCPETDLRDGRKALEYVTTASRLIAGADQLTAVREAVLFDILAAALAETGDFREATTWATRAVALVSNEHKAAFRARADQYERGRPYRLPEGDHGGGPVRR